MSRRYILREGSRGGERIIDEDDYATRLLTVRDNLRADVGQAQIVLDVIDTDATDPPESGIVERCPGCGTVTLASRIEL